MKKQQFKPQQRQPVVAAKPKINIDTNGIDVKGFLAQYKIISGRPIGLPSWLIELAESNGGQLTVEIVKLLEMRLSRTKEFALSIFTIEVDNRTANVLLPMGVFLGDGSAVIELTESRDGRPIFNLLFISDGENWIPSDEIDEEQLKALFE